MGERSKPFHKISFASLTAFLSSIRKYVLNIFRSVRKDFEDTEES